jgi:RNA polymerase primary sigma factor
VPLYTFFRRTEKHDRHKKEGNPMGETTTSFQTSEETVPLSADPRTLCGDPMRFYYYEIGQYDLLSPEKVSDLAQRIEHSKRGKKRRGLQATEEPEEIREAKHLLIMSNLRLVLYVARKYQGLGVDMLDLIQEGNLGLMHAVEKFDATRGYKFSTYACWWIRQYITRALAEQSRTIHVPLYKLEELKRLARIRKRLMSEENEPTLQELAEHMDISVDRVLSLLAVIQDTVSLDVPCKRGDDPLPLGDMLEDDSTYEPEQVVMLQALQEHVEDVLRCLTPRERRVLELRYGLDGEKGRSLHQVERILGISHEAVRQAEFRALGKLERLSRSRMLQDFLT